MKYVTTVIPTESARAFNPRFILLAENRDDTPDKNINTPPKNGARIVNAGLKKNHLGAPKKA
jgi:hypothetical protein